MNQKETHLGEVGDEGEQGKENWSGILGEVPTVSFATSSGSRM